MQISRSAYVLADVVDGCAHLEQVSVRPDHRGGGVGRALLERVRGWAADRGLMAVTLTTFIDVPWNAPCIDTSGSESLPRTRSVPSFGK